MIYGIGASIDISVRSVLRESRPGFPARGHDSESKRSSDKDQLAVLSILGNLGLYFIIPSNF